MDVLRLSVALAGAFAALVVLCKFDGRPAGRPACFAALSAAVAPELRSELAAEKVRAVCRGVEIK